MTGKVQWREKISLCVLTVVLALAIGLTCSCFSTVCQAQTKAKVKVSSANIRQEASTTSEAAGSAKSGDTFDVIGQTQDSQGYTWYQISFDGTKKGYLRADTVDVSEDSASTQNPTTSGTPEIKDIPAVTEGMEAVNPVSATVKGGDSIRIRADVITTSNDNVITKVARGTALTVAGQKKAADGATWYYVNFAKDGKEISGYVHENYVNISGEITPLVTETEVPEENTQTPETVTEPEPVVVKDYDTQLDGGEWYIVDNVNKKRQSIQGLFDAVSQNAAAYEKEAKKAKNEKIIIIILVLLLIAAVGAAGYLFLKLRDMVDQEYFNRVEKDTLSRRRAVTNQRGTHPIKHAGSDAQVHRSAGQGQKSVRPGQGQRPVGAEPQRRPVSQGQRPVGTEPAQRRPVNQGQRPGSTEQTQKRPVNQGQRPSGAEQTQKKPVDQGQRPLGAEQTQKKPANQVQKSAAEDLIQTKTAVQTQKAIDKVKAERIQDDDDDWFDLPVEETLPDQRVAESDRKEKKGGWKAKNFMTEDEDDEFEFEFFNMESDDDL